jgi:hypothetical protein
VCGLNAFGLHDVVVVGVMGVWLRCAALCVVCVIFGRSIQYYEIDEASLHPPTPILRLVNTFRVYHNKTLIVLDESHAFDTSYPWL